MRTLSGESSALTGVLTRGVGGTGCRAWPSSGLGLIADCSFCRLARSNSGSLIWPNLVFLCSLYLEAPGFCQRPGRLFFVLFSLCSPLKTSGGSVFLGSAAASRTRWIEATGLWGALGACCVARGWICSLGWCGWLSSYVPRSCRVEI